MKIIPVILIGCGGVGRQLLHHIVSCRPLHAKQGVHLRVIGVCDSRSLVVASDVLTTELNDKILSEICHVKLGGGSLSNLSNFGESKLFFNTEATKKVIDIATLLGKATGLACVDCSASSDTVNMLKQVVDLGCCIVLANKKPLTSTIDDYNKLITHPRRIRHESTVGAGLPVIVSLIRMLSSGDPVHHIIGSLSGTLGYIMSEVEEGKPLSQVVKVAKSLGYTEPDPRDDLSGMDVARKALILARLLGQQINLGDIKVESLFPKEMGPDVMPIDDFLNSGVLSLDNDIQERVTKASSRGNVLRYACVVECSSLRCEVGLQEFPRESPLGRLKGSDNVLVVYSRCYNERPLVIQGAGAGNDTTAAGVLADILDLQDLF
ncbi:bifunctional aspartokinase/homoserine dehydrogenase 1 isoform X4 [Benincasa hispida]|uniref:bifunctional aspartokinase/homoserine dehydrogenase 1 isoform X4 n=1 Tax=Benincasa hispida TaxID=102211 RepID=UPI0018FF6D67|nr:bifunctional aspartokinase/homoserine dehydrogenase 1 isoform X4 [Benincasa hispida]